jgi:hypothetical protein
LFSFADKNPPLQSRMRESGAPAMTLITRIHGKNEGGRGMEAKARHNTRAFTQKIGRRVSPAP